MYLVQVSYSAACRYKPQFFFEIIKIDLLNIELNDLKGKKVRLIQWFSVSLVAIIVAKFLLLVQYSFFIPFFL